MTRGGVQHVLMMVVLGSVATCALMVTSVISSGEHLRPNFLDEKYEKTFSNNNQTKVTRSIKDTLIHSFL